MAAKGVAGTEVLATLASLVEKNLLTRAANRLMIGGAEAASHRIDQRFEWRDEALDGVFDFAGRPAEVATIASWLTELRGAAIPVVISGTADTEKGLSANPAMVAAGS